MDLIIFLDGFQALKIRGRDNFVFMDPMSPKQQVIGGLGINNMKSRCCLHRFDS